MRVLIDACVLFPTVMREMLVGAAAAGGFVPLWSARILEEWARATRRLPAGARRSPRARSRCCARPGRRPRWRSTRISVARLSLPDPNDRHVLAAAIAGGAGLLMTLNRADFPARTLARHGLVLREPDGYLSELLSEGVDIRGVAAGVQARAERASGRPQPMRALLKRAGLPRLGKALGD